MWAHGVLVLEFDPKLIPMDGEVRIFLYENQQSWEQDSPRDLAVLSKGQLTSGSLRFELPAQVYSISAFIDTNHNGEIDKNPLGIPTEQFALSNIKNRLWMPPNWDEVNFRIIEGQESHLSLKFKYQ